MAKNIMPWWDYGQLEAHWDKRVVDDPGCWEDLLSDPAPELDQYRDRSFKVADRSQSWLVYRGQEIRAGGGKHPASTYYVDNELVKVVVAQSDHRIMTCYHEHWQHYSHDDVMSWPVGERKDRYRKKLAYRRESEKIACVKVLKDA